MIPAPRPAIATCPSCEWLAAMRVRSRNGRRWARDVVTGDVYPLTGEPYRRAWGLVCPLCSVVGTLRLVDDAAPTTRR